MLKSLLLNNFRFQIFNILKVYIPVSGFVTLTQSVCDTPTFKSKLCLYKKLFLFNKHELTSGMKWYQEFIDKIKYKKSHVRVLNNQMFHKLQSSFMIRNCLDNK